MLNFKTLRALYAIVLFSFVFLSISCESDTEESQPDQMTVSQNDEDENQEGSEENETIETISDLSLIGSWRNVDFGSEDVAMSFTLDSLGSISYYRKNQLTGKFEKLEIESDEISVSDNILTFLKSDLCESPLDSIYEIKNDTLFLPLQRYNWNGKDRFVPVEFDTYEGTTRPTSSMKATITANFPAGAVTYNHDASSDFELISGFYSDLSNNLFSFADNEFGCHVPAEQSSQIFLSTTELITGIGNYDLNWIQLQLPDFDEDFSTVGINTFDGLQSPLVSGGLEVTLYEELDDLRRIIGTFSFVLEADFSGEKYTVELTDGSFEVFLRPNPS
ncbi:hypothetical protein [Flagellimonas meridianipacifica]|uniref:Lipocalin-like protein n=1 Tax=Flagellimonas meridianipacifica TaxID=1080225 RepID=A0A2T0MI99_9FLAO|nr:hypothetical protein [Allomuricauda pacifica]PRX57312.1 hypothetical protein CLV81_1315 [Allomuricauda pacifica]